MPVEYAPTLQVVHTAEVLAPAGLPYAPMAQDVQADVPVVMPEYAPASHAQQAAPDVYRPAAQAPGRHTPGPVAPNAAENVPEGQVVQATGEVAPNREEYVPAPQAVHAVAAGVLA